MARVTIEDCVKKVADRFELVALAAQRTKDIAAGAELKLERRNEKNPVIALREIAADLIHVEDLRENIVKFHQKEHRIQRSDEYDGTEISDEELDQEDFELKELEEAEREQSSQEEITEEIAEVKAADETADELEQSEDIPLEGEQSEDEKDL